MGIELYPYQQEGHDAVFSEFNAGREAALVVWPTGTGKTVLGADAMPATAQASKVGMTDTWKRKIAIAAARLSASDGSDSEDQIGSSIQSGPRRWIWASAKRK